jgi:hypothetical protein
MRTAGETRGCPRLTVVLGLLCRPVMPASTKRKTRARWARLQSNAQSLQAGCVRTGPRTGNGRGFPPTILKSNAHNRTFEVQGAGRVARIGVRTKFRMARPCSPWWGRTHDIDGVPGDVLHIYVDVERRSSVVVVHEAFCRRAHDCVWRWRLCVELVVQVMLCGPFTKTLWIFVPSRTAGSRA